jgi:hypothetical protein
MKLKDILKDLEEITAIQTSNGNWNYDPYMHGMANGMILSLATITNSVRKDPIGKEPKFLTAPKNWLSKKQ